MTEQESATEAWRALLGGAMCADYRVALVADAETCNDVAVRLRPVSGGMEAEVFVVRSDGMELPPFDRCFVPAPPATTGKARDGGA